MKEEKAKIDHAESLLSEFEQVSYEKWKEIAEGSLKGKPFEKLIGKTLEGIDIQPIYIKEDVDGIKDVNSMPGFYPFDRGSNPDGYIIKKWDIAQEIPYPTPELLNGALKNDLQKGQTAISIVVDDLSKNGESPKNDPKLLKNGTSVFCETDYFKALDGIDITKTPIYIKAELATSVQYAIFIYFLKKRNIEMKSINGGFFFDPIAIALDDKYEKVDIQALYGHQQFLLSSIKSWESAFKPICIDTAFYHEAGSDAVQEVAFSLSTGVQYLRSLQNEEISIDEIAGKTFFNVAFGPAFFIEIAKMLAMRKLWAKVVKEFGGSEDSGKIHLFARTSKLNKSRLDQYVNLLRNTTEALSAILSGCDALHVEYFDEPFGSPSEFSRRVARNIQLVLMEECNLPDVIDPVGGTWFVEKLTEEIAEKAWSLFVEIEKQGGMIKAIENNFVQGLIEEKAKQRLTQLSNRKDILVGTNKYPNKNEKEAKPFEYDNKELSAERIAFERSVRLKNKRHNVVHSIDVFFEIADQDKHFNRKLSIHFDDETKSYKKIKPLILCEMFEDIREKSEKYKAKTGKLPQVFLANVGTVKEYKGRADFSADFFSVGGFDVISKMGNESWEEVAKEAIESQAEVITICSTDLKYPEFVPQFCRLIKRAKPMTTIVLAGYPKEHIEEFKAAGLDDLIHIKSDIIETLNNIYQRIGI
jgi:methylmalonyl-CoA mutase